MNGIIYYSNTNQSRTVAAYLSDLTGWTLYDLGCHAQAKRAASIAFERVVLVFPVHCQRVPDAIADCLRELRAKKLGVVATYGKMCHGNVLYEIQKKYLAGDIVAGAYVPMQHAYLPASEPTDLEVLRELAAKITEPVPSPVHIPRAYKNPLADLFPKARSRMGVSVRINPERCAKCGKCERECTEGGVMDGRFTSKCIRCLKCAVNCPAGAIVHRNRLPMRLYLEKKPKEQAEVYL